MELVVKGIPEAQARPRRGRYGNFYSPKSAWYSQVLTQAILKRPRMPLDGPLSLHVQFFFPRVKSRPSASWCVSKPDWDNCGKVISDALQSAGWMKNDSTIVVALIEKCYCGPQIGPGAVIELRQIKHDDPRWLGKWPGEEDQFKRTGPIPGPQVFDDWTEEDNA